jgi:hypothetical protein
MPNLTMTATTLNFGFGKVRIQVNVHIMQILGVFKALNFIVAIKAALLSNFSVPGQYQGLFFNALLGRIMAGKAGSDSCSDRAVFRIHQVTVVTNLRGYFKVVFTILAHVFMAVVTLKLNTEILLVEHHLMVEFYSAVLKLITYNRLVQIIAVLGVTAGPQAGRVVHIRTRLRRIEAGKIFHNHQKSVYPTSKEVSQARGVVASEASGPFLIVDGSFPRL